MIEEVQYLLRDSVELLHTIDRSRDAISELLDKALNDLNNKTVTVPAPLTDLATDHPGEPPTIKKELPIMTLKEIGLQVRELFKTIEENNTKLNRAYTLCLFASEMLQEVNESNEKISDKYYFELDRHIKDAICQDAIDPTPLTDSDAISAGAHELPVPN